MFKPTKHSNYIIRFWVNGVVVQEMSLAVGLEETTQRDLIRFGRRPNYKCLTSSMMCAAFYDKAVTADEVSELMDVCSNGKIPETNC